MTTKLERALAPIAMHFHELRGVILMPRDLQDMFRQNRHVWGLPVSMTQSEFIEAMTTRLELQTLQLTSEHYAPVTRYVWGKEYSPYLLGLSLKPGAYLSHATAVFLHGLTAQIPKTIYVNREQTPKPASSTPLSQERLRMAMAREQRVSALVYTLGDYRYALLSGKNTGKLEVGEITGSYGEVIPLTKVERTLIDITVRPVYAGGITQVLEAYRTARESLSVNVLVATLRKLKYVYPYHQSIGFLMERAGFPVSHLSFVKSLGLDFDFYLVHGMKNPEYDSNWRLFYPKGL